MRHQGRADTRRRRAAFGLAARCTDPVIWAQVLEPLKRP
jgi:hypothetical protein